MLRGNVVSGGILCVLFAALTLSCGETSPTQPDLPARIVAVPASEVFANSPQQEPRELLIDGRPTDIEWNLTGSPVLVLLKGNVGTGGEYYASVRAYWTYNPFNGDSVALYLLVQWADRGPDRLEQPLVTSIDWQDDDNHSLIDCGSSDPLHVEANWHQELGLHEDQIEVEIYSDESGALPADRWRWGVATTDPVTPTSSTEFSSVPPGSRELFGQNAHPTAGWSEDYYNSGAGWVLDAGARTQEPNTLPGSNVPLFIAGKGGRDVRMNRGKPASLMIWKYVAQRLSDPCDSLNPIRLEDASARQKTWNPEDYVQSYVSQMPGSSQADVVTRGGWDMGKWAVEMRRRMETREPDSTGAVSPQSPPHLDDVWLHTGRTYGFRLRIYNASKTEYSESPLIPLYIKPRS
jgi:hypothetical protein